MTSGKDEATLAEETLAEDAFSRNRPHDGTVPDGLDEADHTGFMQTSASATREAPERGLSIQEVMNMLAKIQKDMRLKILRLLHERLQGRLHEGLAQVSCLAQWIQDLPAGISGQTESDMDIIATTWVDFLEQQLVWHYDRERSNMEGTLVNAAALARVRQVVRDQ